MTIPNRECNHGNDCENIETAWRAGRFCWSLEREAIVMAILNVTPDSFSDGGSYDSVEKAVATAKEFIVQGAEIIDVGGESTRPGAPAVDLDEELARVIPVIKALVAQTSAAISIDTCKPKVARAALEAGADIVNDISGLRNEEMIKVCAESECGIVTMHMQGTPQTMQYNPSYEDVVAEVRGFFEERYQTFLNAGIAPDRIAFDPGIGFGKSIEHNKALLSSVRKYQVGDRPILMGLSRKSFIATLLESDEMESRESPTVALTAMTRIEGAMIHRVHSVASSRESLRMLEAVIV